MKKLQENPWGKLLAVVAAGTEPGEIKVEISSSGMEPATVVLQAEACETEEGIGADAWRIDESRAQKETEQYCEDIPVRALRLQASNGTILTPENAWTVQVWPPAARATRQPNMMPSLSSEMTPSASSDAMRSTRGPLAASGERSCSISRSPIVCSR